MASDQQMALTRAHRTSNISRATRQVVPQFLQKLYEMVNDPANVDLIRWSDAGDSFFVLDHERFAREVLGRWFKHQNFSSFVRQLNMYGFHKIPHLQQGVLKSDTDTEYWNFVHPSFRRGQPDLLCLIQRKKQVNQPGDEPAIDIRDATAGIATAAPPTNLSAGQLLDIHSIVNGIAAIKRHQTTISSELNELKRSNQLLWQDAITARARHQKHQDTINRILKFLAGVFGHGAGSVHKEDGVDHAPSRAVVPRQPTRLMIESGPQRAAKSKVGITEVEDEEDARPFHRELSTEQFARIETPASTIPPSSGAPSPSVAPSIAPSPSVVDESTPFFPPTSQTTQPPPVSTNNTYSFANSTSPAEPLQYPPTTDVSSHNSLTTSSNQSINTDPMLQAFNHIIQSPGQMQRLLAALASQTIPEQPSIPQGSEPSSLPQSASSSQLTSYGQPYDFSRPFSEHSPATYAASPSIPIISSPSPKPEEDIVPFDPRLAESTGRVEKTWKAAEDIDKDVNALQHSISSLIETFGLDPSLMAPAAPGDAPDPLALPPSLDNSAPPLDMPGPEFDFDAFLNEFSHPDIPADDGDIASTAFLDEVPSDGTASPITHLQHDSPEFSKTKGRKRKSDVTDLDEDATKTSTGAKPKRKK